MEASKHGFEADPESSIFCKTFKEQKSGIRDFGEDILSGQNDEKHKNLDDNHTESNQALNCVFGYLMDILFIFSMMNSEISTFVKDFELIEQSNDVKKLNKDIIPKILSCLKERIGPDPNNPIRNAKLQEWMSLFEENVESFAGFYKRLLIVYTVSSLLCEYLNKPQMNGQWHELNGLLKYSFCLCKAFYYMKKECSMKKKCIDFDLKTSEDSNYMLLYRGLELEEREIESYKQKIGTKISWKQPISTSFDPTVAQEFAWINKKDNTFCVVFIIEVLRTNSPNAGHSRYLNLKKLSKDKEMPLTPGIVYRLLKEKEVLLAPGSVFEIIEVMMDLKGITKIRIRLKNDLKSQVLEGTVMIGPLLRGMAIDTGMKIAFCSGKKLAEYLKFIIGCTLIEELEFCVCEFEKKTLEDLMRLLQTLKGLKKLKFISCSYKNTKSDIDTDFFLSTSNFYFKAVEFTETRDFYRILNLGWKHWKSLKKLKINFTPAADVTDETLNNKAYFLINASNLISLTLKFEQIKRISDQGFEIFLSKTSQLCPQLAFLKIQFQDCQDISHKLIYSLFSKRAQLFPQLKSLNMILHEEERMKTNPSKDQPNVSTPSNMSWRSNDYFPEKDRIKENSLEIVNEKSTKYFKFFNEENQIRIESSAEFESIKNSSAEITIDSEDCFKKLRTQSKQLGFNQPTSLCFQFKRWTDATFSDEKIKCLKFLAKTLSEVKYLELNFEDCSNISNQALFNLSEILNSCSLLVSLSLNLKRCFDISDESAGMDKLDRFFRSISKVKFIELNFSICNKITGNLFKSEGFQNLAKLETLSLNFSDCPKITNEQVCQLFGLFQFYQNLKHIYLNFESCVQITDNLTFDLCSDSTIMYLVKLITLEMNFNKCPSVSSMMGDTLKQWLAIVAGFTFKNAP